MLHALVVGVEDGRDGLGALLVADRCLVLASVELLKVKLAAGSLAGPKTEVVCRWSLVAGD